MWFEGFVEKCAVLTFPGLFLERQGNQVAEPSLRERVLIGKETVVRVQPDAWSSFHRLGQEERTELPREGRRNRLLEEEPDVPATSRSRPLRRCRQVARAAGVDERRHVLLPPVLVEVDSQEEAGLVPQHRVDTCHEGVAGVVVARQVPPDDVVGDGKEAPVGTVATLDTRLLADPANPLVRTGRGIAGLARPAALEPARVDVLPASEQRTEQSDLLARRRLLADAHRLHPIPDSDRSLTDRESNSAAQDRNRRPAVPESGRVNGPATWTARGGALPQGPAWLAASGRRNPGRASAKSGLSRSERTSEAM